MTIEERLKELILLRYHTVKDFSKVIGLSYSTVDSILRRGVANSGVSNIIKICKELGISADELAEGKIVVVEDNPQPLFPFTDIQDIITFTRSNLASYGKLTLDGEPLNDEDINALMDALEVAVSVIRRKKNK